MTIYINAGFSKPRPNHARACIRKVVQNMPFEVSTLAEIRPQHVREHPMAMLTKEGWTLEGYCLPTNLNNPVFVEAP